MRNPFKKKPRTTEELDEDIKKLEKQIKEAQDYETSIKTLPENSKERTHVRGVKAKVMDRVKPERTYLINMELRNGMHTTLSINTSKNHFKYAGGVYVIDPQMQYFHVASRTYALDYHQDFTLPIKREFDVKGIQATIKQLGRIDPEQITTATNPSALESFMEGKVIEQLMKAQDIDAFFKQMRLIFIIGLVLNALTFIILVKSTGMLDNLKLPF